MSMDGAELGELVRDLGRIRPNVGRKVKPIVSKGALNIKAAMQADARKSSSFRNLAPTISYDLTVADVFGTGIVKAEVGPTLDNGPSASLAGLAYFGGSRGGGGTVRDPAQALADEEPSFVRYMGDLAEDIL